MAMGPAADTWSSRLQMRARPPRASTTSRTPRDAGYGLLKDIAGLTCIDMPGMGGMGVHYVNRDADRRPERSTRGHPEALVYAPDRDGTLRLAAARVHRRQSGAGTRTHSAPPAALRTAPVRRHPGAEPVRARAVLLPARLGLEVQQRRPALDVEPRRSLQPGLVARGDDPSPPGGPATRRAGRKPIVLSDDEEETDAMPLLERDSPARRLLLHAARRAARARAAWYCWPAKPASASRHWSSSLSATCPEARGRGVRATACPPRGRWPRCSTSPSTSGDGCRGVEDHADRDDLFRAPAARVRPPPTPAPSR